MRPLDRWERWLLAGLGVGYAPLLPGTAGSLATALAVLVAGRWGLGVPAALLLLVLGSVATLALAGRARRPDGRGDPGWVVSDEVAGQAIASGVATALGGAAALPLVAFLVFRLLDMTKPPPIRGLERLPGGWGVLADDLAAGTGAALVVLLLAALGLGA